MPEVVGAGSKAKDKYGNDELVLQEQRLPAFSVYNATQEEMNRASRLNAKPPSKLAANIGRFQVENGAELFTKVVNTVSIRDFRTEFEAEGLNPLRILSHVHTHFNVTKILHDSLLKEEPLDQVVVFLFMRCDNKFVNRFNADVDDVMIEYDEMQKVLETREFRQRRAEAKGDKEKLKKINREEHEKLEAYKALQKKLEQEQKDRIRREAAEQMAQEYKRLIRKQQMEEVRRRQFSGPDSKHRGNFNGEAKMVENMIG